MNKLVIGDYLFIVTIFFAGLLIGMAFGFLIQIDERVQCFSFYNPLTENINDSDAHFIFYGEELFSCKTLQDI